MKKHILTLLLLTLALAARAVDLARCHIVISENDVLQVKKIATLLSDDIERVTHCRPSIDASMDANRCIVALATLEHLADICPDAAIAAQFKTLEGKWECYKIMTLGQQLLIVGSDPRGLAYGALHVSEKIGVSPWYWWADVPIPHRKKLNYVENFTSSPPSVKYRGIFINDEDWGLKPWASKNYERELGDIGPRTYARVCELILRLKGNMLGPAMHSCTGAFYSHPESKLVADSLGIIITTSHCEPLLINTAAKTEWDIDRDGDWNYKTNPEAIRRKWDARLTEASQFENIYTTAMRGLHDARLRGNLPLNEQVELIGQLIVDQRKLLSQHKKKAPEEIPQIFVPYKETMAIYEAGLKVPDDITLVWVDDNYGYMKRVSNPQEQQRSGGSGVYYHISYLGAPHDYLWISTAPPVLMYEELRKAYDTGANRYWLLNVGDIKPMELGMQTFFDLAWDIDRFNFRHAHEHQARFLTNIFGRHGFQDILDEYYRLAWIRKPEFMGWEREWTKNYPDYIIDTQFSFQNYGEAQLRLQQYQALSDRVARIEATLPVNLRPAFFELLGYPVRGAYQMNRKFLMAQFNHELAAQGDSAHAEWAARQSVSAFDSIRSLTATYNNQLDGKWRHMMTIPPGLRARYQEMPQLVRHPVCAADAPHSLDVAQRHDEEGYHVIRLEKYSRLAENNEHKIQLVSGLGYDWQVIQLGEPTAPVADPTNIKGARVEYTFPAVNRDSLTVELHTVPFWPIFKGRGTRIGISVDGSQPQVYDNTFRENSPEWNDQVLQNGDVARLSFAVDKSLPHHTLALICGDPGMMVEKVIIDWGGLRPSYIGPPPASPKSRRKYK